MIKEYQSLLDGFIFEYQHIPNFNNFKRITIKRKLKNKSAIMINQYTQYHQENKMKLDKLYSRFQGFIKIKSDDGSSILKDFRKTIKQHVIELIDIYSVINNSIALLNKFAKSRSIQKRIDFVFTPQYSIANIYEKYTLIYRMNLITMMPTKSSPNQFSISI